MEVNLEKADIYKQVEEANKELIQAWQNFENAEKDMVEVAIYELKAKQLKYDILSKKAFTVKKPEKKVGIRLWILEK